MQSIEGSKNIATSDLCEKFKYSKPVIWQEYRPLKFQLTEPNIVHLVIVPCRTELDVLMIFRIPESELCGFVKAIYDVIYIIKEG
jgi:hypothetical protein